MLNISAAALLIFGTGFLRVMFSVASMQTHPGERVTMWCSHNIHVSGDLFWFKQTDGDVPITIVHKLYTESLQNLKSNYFNNFTKDLMVMDLFKKSVTSLTIKKVKMSDSGFYFCGDAGHYIKFSKGTRLEVKAHVEKRYNLKTTMVNYLTSPTVFTSEKYYTGISKKDHEESSTSTEECSGDIYFKLTFLFGGIIFFSCIFPLCLVIIREHRKKKQKKVAEFRIRQHDNKNLILPSSLCSWEDDSVIYSDVNFSNKSHKTAGRHTEYTTAVHTAV